MKDYIVFFTEGFDKYNIDKQKKAYPKAFVSTINSAPDYNALKEEAKKAKNEGYDNFYMLWERNSVHSVTDDMKTEFIEFHETGALPYKYNKKLIEGDASVVANQTPANTINPTPNQNIDNSGMVNQAQAEQQLPPQPGQQAQPNQGYTELGSMNVSYSADHAASIFIWPINAYTSEKSMRNALIQLDQEFKKDHAGRSPEQYKSTSTVYSTKKGPWASIIYVPSSIKELGQVFGNSAAMINEIAAIYSDTDIFKAGMGLRRGNAFFGITKEDLNKNGAKMTGGFLDEASFLAEIRKLRGDANKHNIAIFCTEPYKKYFSWCPKVVVIGNTLEPDINANKLLKEVFDRIETYEKETVSASDENPDNINSPYLTRVDFKNDNVIKTFNIIDKKCLNAFFAYYEWYLKYRAIDPFGAPNFNIKAKSSENESSTEKFFKELDEFFKLGHMQDLEKIRQALGLKDKSFTGLLAPYKKWQKAKEVAESGKNAWDSRKKINWDKISKKFSSGQQLTPEEKAEWDRIMAEFDASENAKEQAAANSANTQENTDVQNNEAGDSNNQEGQANNQTTGDSKNQQVNKQDTKSDVSKDEKGTKKGTQENSVEAKESIMLDLVDVFMKKFYESEQSPSSSATDTNQNNGNATETNNTATNDINSNTSNDLSEQDKLLIIRLYSLTRNSGYKGSLVLSQVLQNFSGHNEKGIGSLDNINELLVAIDEAKKPQVRQEKLNELNKAKQNNQNGNVQADSQSTDKPSPEATATTEDSDDIIKETDRT